MTNDQIVAQEFARKTQSVLKMLFENLALGSAIGAAVGLVMGAAIDAQRHHETDSDE